MGTASLVVYFYPRSPCGERQFHCQHHERCRCISIHALLAESDLIDLVDSPVAKEFLSTLSLRRATRRRFLPERGHWISIHALLAESDSRAPPTVEPLEHFYPRSPCGERPAMVSRLSMSCQFLSTLSLRRATLKRAIDISCFKFLSTLSLRRATQQTEFYAQN